MSRVDALAPVKALGLALLMGRQSEELHAGPSPPGPGSHSWGLSTGDPLASLLVFVIVGSLTIAAPVVYYLVGGDDAETRLNEMKDWLAMHTEAVTAVVFPIFGADLIARACHR